MPVTDTVRRVPISDIKINRDDRQRQPGEAEVNVDDLLESVRKNGVLTPILLDDDMTLIFGERRLTAARKCGHSDILARFASELNPIQRQIIELEENIKRKDLEWHEAVDAVGRIHQLYRDEDPDWTQGETANALSMTHGTVSMYLRVWESRDEERVKNAGTIREAYNAISRMEKRAMGDALAEILEVTNEIQPQQDTPQVIERLPEVADGASPERVVLPAASGPKAPPAGPTPDQSILHESFLTWAPTYSGKKFNLLHCDFPYGVGLFDGELAGGARHGGYDDTAETYWTLVDCLCNNLDRLFAVSGHIMFWLSADDEIVQQTRTRFAQLAPSIEWHKFRLVWHKTDNAGIAGDHRRHPRHVYESCLLGSRGRRQIVKIMSDVYGAPTDKKLHVSTKPEPMLKHFMSMLVDDNTRLLDPTCGSGAALRAAEELGAGHVLGLEIDEENVRLARTALGNARKLRKIARGGL